MLKLEIKLNERLVEQEAKYPPHSIYQTLDKMFGKYNLSKSILLTHRRPVSSARCRAISTVCVKTEASSTVRAAEMRQLLSRRCSANI